MRGIIIVLMLTLSLSGIAQVYETVDGEIKLFTEAPFENITASNQEIVSYIDLSSGYILIDIAVKQFEFNRGMMYRQFNDYYLETEQYPKAEFFGKILGYDIEKRGLQQVTTTGELTIHGVTKIVKSTGQIQIENGKLRLYSRFSISIDDFGIDSPMFLFHPVAETVDITVDLDYYLTGS